MSDRTVKKAFGELRTLCTSVIGFHELAERPGIAPVKRVEYEAQITASGLALALKLIATMDALTGQEKTRADSLYEAVGQAATEFDYRCRTLLTNVCVLAEQMAAPDCAMDAEARRVAAETIFACGEALTLELATFTHMITPEKR